MTEHLPECLHDDRTYGLHGLCICQELRACEKRVLLAAREAVAATFTGWCKDYMNCTDYEHVCGSRRGIIAAIDALREQEK